MPSNIVENFGNASGVTVTTNISYNLQDKVVEDKLKVCIAGFGVGLTWSSLILDLDKLNFNKIIEF
jgi:3-oxoacyl-[acyl-carrier-protein] synthase-3